ncbi:MAG TPA: hypothetical protein VJH05_01440 [Candidatus Paceibacterota bacterium]
MRNKPEPARQAVALLIAIIITAIIVGIWFSFRTFFQSPPATQNTPSPFSILWSYIKSFGE